MKKSEISALGVSGIQPIEPLLPLSCSFALTQQN